MTTYLSLSITLEDDSEPVVTVCDATDKHPTRLTSICFYGAHGAGHLNANTPELMRRILLDALHQLDEAAGEPGQSAIDHYTAEFAAHQRAFFDQVATREQTAAGLAECRAALRGPGNDQFIEETDDDETKARSLR